MVPLDPLWLAEVGIYNRSSTCGSTVLLDLAEQYFESGESAVSFEKSYKRIDFEPGIH